MNSPNIVELTASELGEIDGGFWREMLMAQLVEAIAKEIGGLLGAYSVAAESGLSFGTATPTGNEMYPYTDGCL